MLQRDHAALADSLRTTYAEHVDELARVAEGGPVTRDTVIAASVIAASAVEVLAALPLAPWWLGFVAGWDVDRMLSVARAAELDTTTGGR